MSLIFVPSRSAEDWKPPTAESDPRTGPGVDAMASCWQAANGFPGTVREAFDRSGLATFTYIEPLLILPGYEANLPDAGAFGPNAIFILAKSADQLISMVVVGDPDASFCRTVSDWMQNPTARKVKQLLYLCSELNVPVDDVMALSYPLLQHTVAAKLLAQRFQTGGAMMLVHSFAPRCMGFDAYARFAALFGIEAEEGMVQHALRFDGLVLSLGWVGEAGLGSANAE